MRTRPVASRLSLPSPIPEDAALAVRRASRKMSHPATKHPGPPLGRGHLQSIQALRAIAAAMVVIYHLVHAENVYGGGATFLGGLAHFGFAGVDVFFVISGFIIATITAGRFGSTAGAFDFLGRRALRIPLYWLCSAAIVLTMIVRPGSLDASIAEKSILHSLLLLPQEGGPMLIVGWTLTYELFFYTMTAIALAVCSRSRIPRLIAVWAIVLLIIEVRLGLCLATPDHLGMRGWEPCADTGRGIYPPRPEAPWHHRQQGQVVWRSSNRAHEAEIRPSNSAC